MRSSPSIELQDIFIRYEAGYRESAVLSRVQSRAMSAIGSCRTDALGGHVDQCDTCGEMRISYNSCRNRHCPKCQFLKKEQWLDDRACDILPIEYFHVVFTIPDTLNPLFLNNQKDAYDILFQSASETLTLLARDEKHIGARIGFTAILHTWGQNVLYHPHLHVIVTGGGLGHDNDKWISCRENFIFPVRVLSRMFRGKFLHHLKARYKKGEIKLPCNSNDFHALLDDLYQKEWVVYAKPPFNNAENLFAYLGRYTHRIAISNHRIQKVENDKVFFKWRDYSDGNTMKVMSLNAFEFIRRFLLHVLPHRFVKIRHYGIFSNRNRKVMVETCRRLLCVYIDKVAKVVESWQERLLRLSGFDVLCCPFCKKGKMVACETLSPAIHSPPFGRGELV